MIWDLIKSYRQAFRIFVRSRTRPKTVEEAEEKRLFFARMYAAVGFLCLLYCTYKTYKENINFKYRTDVRKELAVADALVKNRDKKVVVYEGFTRIGEYDLRDLKPEESKS